MKTWLRLIIITMTVGGGFSGFMTTSQFLFHHPEKSEPLGILLAACFCALNVFAIVSGLLFANNPRRTRPLIAVLAISIPCIVSPFINYNFATGASIVLSAGTADGPSGFNLHAAWGMGSSFEFSLMKAHRWSIGVNVFALAILVLLLRSIRPPAPIIQPSSSVEPAPAAFT
jgi:hypothetical protein